MSRQSNRHFLYNLYDQLQPLWEDVLAKTLELLRPYTGQIPRKHFMGAVVVRGLGTNGLEYQAFEVIDGQQRLTTIQLLLLALRDYATERALPTVTAILTGMTENPPLNGREYERWKVVPTTRDRKDYEAIWEARSPEQLVLLYPKVLIPGRRRYAAPGSSKPTSIFSELSKNSPRRTAIPTKRHCSRPILWKLPGG